MTDALDRIAAALERIAAVAEAWAQPSTVVTPFDPRLDPPEPDWRMPTEAPRVYRLSGDISRTEYVELAADVVER